LIFPFLFAVEELYGTQYQSGYISLIDVVFTACVVFGFFFSIPFTKIYIRFTACIKFNVVSGGMSCE